MVIGYDKNVLILAFYDTSSEKTRPPKVVAKPAEDGKEPGSSIN